MGTAEQVVFIEGDGVPWTEDGLAPSLDPTPVNPLAFRLMLKTPATGFYVTRPCYFGVEIQSCESKWWTSARYSAVVVDSIAKVVEQSVDPASSIIIVGYSGGGALAMLVAPRLRNAVAVVTVAGLLDTDAWTQFHGYDRLVDSINPSESVMSPNILQIHLIGQKDRNIPSDQTVLATGNWKGAVVLRYPSYGHVCCWERDWTKIWQQIVSARESADHTD
jgi:pimeloyl-ACP methyl ester carboxylesterase